MTKLHQEELLQALYEQSKKTTSMPSDVKENVIDHAKNSRYPFAFLMKWQTICAVFFVGWLWFDASRTEMATYTVTKGYTSDNQLIYYHKVNYQSQEPSDNTDKIHLTQDPQYFSYMDSLAQLKSGNQLAGIIKQSDKEVVVEICQLGLIKLSPSVLDNLNIPTRVGSLRVGQNVLLMADNKGQFFAIEPDERGEQCAE